MHLDNSFFLKLHFKARHITDPWSAQKMHSEKYMDGYYTSDRGREAIFGITGAGWPYGWPAPTSIPTTSQRIGIIQHKIQHAFRNPNFALGIGGGLVLAGLHSATGSANDFYDYRFPLNKNPDDIASFSGGEELMVSDISCWWLELAIPGCYNNFITLFVTVG